MQQPGLAVLRRHMGTVVRLERRPARTSPGVGAELWFGSAEDAERYLRHWLDDDGAFRQIRRALSDAGEGRALSQRSNAEVARSLAQRLVGGSLVLVEHAESHVASGGRPIAPAAVEEPAWADTQWPAEPSAAPVPELPKPPAVPLLPLLEEVQIEGAYVLPEVLQTLEEIDATLGTLQLAGVSLEPAPSGISAITAAMQQASTSTSATIDSL